VNASRKFALMAVECASLGSGKSLHRNVQLEVQLQQSMPLPNLGMNQMDIQKTSHVSSRPCKVVVGDFDGEQLQHMQCIKTPFDAILLSVEVTCEFFFWAQKM